MRRVVAALIVALFAVAVAVGAAPVDEAQVTAIASQLRCVVCQNLSVADSPSEMARQMRGVIRERLARGETPEQVMAYFVDKYGEWILLSPRPQGFNLVVWVAPFAGLFAGLGIVLLVVLRWTRRPPTTPEALAPADRERVRAELDRLDE